MPRQLPNATHAHLRAINLSALRHATACAYGVLVRVSTGYPPLGGRLHTRYAPIRRSPPGYCYPALPLDLHVLGLPLAFILSQDQTLHCKNCLFVYLLDSFVSPPSPFRKDVRHTLSLASSVSNSSRLPSRTPVRLSKAGAKIQPFF